MSPEAEQLILALIRADRDKFQSETVDGLVSGREAFKKAHTNLADYITSLEQQLLLVNKVKELLNQ